MFEDVRGALFRRVENEVIDEAHDGRLACEIAQAVDVALVAGGFLCHKSGDGRSAGSAIEPVQSGLELGRHGNAQSHGPRQRDLDRADGGAVRRGRRRRRRCAMAFPEAARCAIGGESRRQPALEQRRLRVVLGLRDGQAKAPGAQAAASSRSPTRPELHERFAEGRALLGGEALRSARRPRR
ncbi:MAG: hypothetical protein U1E87_08240 [Alphaproteobacteria bacterium]